MKIELLGTSFSIQTDEDPQYVQDLVDYYRTKVQDVQARITAGDPLKIAIVAGVLTADELFRLRERAAGTTGAAPGEHSGAADVPAAGRSDNRDAAGESAQVAEITEKLIEALDHSLADSQPPDPHSPDSAAEDSEPGDF
jgi:cell division protein ZapA (FtsZ GTPase activity inhibitor)